MIEHYKSYQDSVVKDLPVGFTAFLKNQSTTNLTYPTLNDYFFYLIGQTDKALKKEDRESYYASIRLHQKALIKALVLFHKNYIPDNSMPLKTWKFTDVVAVFDKFTWIPRYSDEFAEYKGPVFSCSEMEVALKLSPQDAQLILKNKEDKVLTKQQQLIPLQEVNKTIVHDWMLPL
jgi:hypothetical protein